MSPAIPGMNLAAYGDRVYIYGEKAGNTTYTVTIKPELPDTFGETKKLTFKVGPADPRLSWGYGDVITLDPEAKPALTAISVGQKTLKLEVRRVGPQDWPSYALWQRDQRWAERPKALPGQLLATKDVAVTGAGGAAVESTTGAGPCSCASWAPRAATAGIAKSSSPGCRPRSSASRRSTTASSSSCGRPVYATAGRWPGLRCSSRRAAPAR